MPAATIAVTRQKRDVLTGRRSSVTRSVVVETVPKATQRTEKAPIAALPALAEPDAVTPVRVATRDLFAMAPDDRVWTISLMLRTMGRTKASSEFPAVNADED